jgi:hypothetical protein
MEGNVTMKLLIKIFGSNGQLVYTEYSSNQEHARRFVDNWLWYNGDTGYVARCWDSSGNPLFEVAL